VLDYRHAEIERLRNQVECLRRALLNPCRAVSTFANPAPCGKCKACQEIQMALDASEEEE